MNILLRGVRAARTALLRSSWSLASSPLLGVPGHSLLHVDTSRPAEPEDTFVRKQVREGRLDLRSPEKTFDHFTNDELHRASTWLGEIIGHTPTEAELYMFTAGVLRELEDRGIEPGFLPLPDRDDPALNDYLTKYSDMWGVDARPPPRFLAEHIVDQHHPPEPLEPMTDAEHEQLQADIEAFKKKHGMSVQEMAARMTGAPIPEEPGDAGHDPYAIAEPKSPFD